MEHTTEPRLDKSRARSNGRGRRRDEDFDRRILAAGFEELSRGGISHFSVAAVAHRAGVSKGSVYLRWPSRDQLILDCALLVRSGISTPGTGNLLADLEELAEQWAAAWSRPGAIEVVLRIDADRAEYPALFERIFEHLQEGGNRIISAVIDDAKQRGEVAPSVSPALVTRMFVGAMFVQALRPPDGPSSITPQFRRELVDFLADALLRPASPTQRGAAAQR